jgi:hypothetical protein
MLFKSSTDLNRHAQGCFSSLNRENLKMSAALLLALGFGAAGVSVLWIVDAAQKRSAAKTLLQGGSTNGST